MVYRERQYLILLMIFNNNNFYILCETLKFLLKNHIRNIRIICNHAIINYISLRLRKNKCFVTNKLV
jgi:hypothetical protein